MTRMIVVPSQVKASKLPINPQANPMASGYSMDLYCDRINDNHSQFEFPHQFLGETFAECARAARNTGWKIHKNGFATCPRCR